jgi:hypothetical protein
LEQVTISVSGGEAPRNLTLPKGTPIGSKSLHREVERLSGLAVESKWSYVDEDGDSITVSTDSEVCAYNCPLCDEVEFTG